MATIKSYTDIEQSKKLAEILPLESADNEIVSFGDRYGIKTVIMLKETLDVIRTPFADIREITMCWSLTALLEVLPDGTIIAKDETDTENEKYMCVAESKDDIINTFGNNPVDACVAMIEKLNELNLL